MENGVNKNIYSSELYVENFNKCYKQDFLYVNSTLDFSYLFRVPFLTEHNFSCFFVDSTKYFQVIKVTT